MNELQNIKLPDFLITDWYKSHLIETEVPTIAKPVVNNNTPIVPVVPAVTVQATIPSVTAVHEPVEVAWYTGDNKKHVTIIINQDNRAVISTEWSTFLTSVLSACKLTLNDVVIVNTHKKTINYSQIITQFKSQYLIVFDVAPSLIGIPAAIPNYDIRVNDNCSFVFSESIALMLNNTADAKQVKMRLWTSLKKFFNV
jgi:hypothetical protein